MSLRAAAARGVVWTTLEKWGRQGLRFGFFVILSRLLGPEEIGVVAAAMVLMGLLELLTTQGFPTAIIKLRTVTAEHLDSVFLLSLAASLLLGGSVFASAGFLADLLQSPDSAGVLRALAVLVPLAALTVVPTGMLRREMRFNTLARRTLVATVAGGVVGVTMAFMGFGVWSLVGQHLVYAIVGVVWLWSVVAWRPRLRFSWSHFVEILPVSASLIGTSLVSFGYLRIDRAIIGGVLGATLLGHYAVGARLVQMIQEAVVNPLVQVAVPTFSAAQDDPDRLMRAYYGLTRLATLAGFPMCVGLGLTAHLCVPLVFGAKWMPAVPVVQVLSVTGALYVLYIGTHPLSVAKGKAHVIFWLNLVHAVLAIAGASIGTRWGIAGVATGVVASWLVMTLVGCSVMHRVLDVRILRLARSASLAAGASAVMALAVVGAQIMAQRLMVADWGRLGISVVVGACVYAAVLCAATPRPIEQLLGQLRLLRSKPTVNRPGVADAGLATAPAVSRGLGSGQ